MYGMKKRNQLNKKELRSEEVSAKAFEVYSNSDLYFYEDQNGSIYLDNQDGYCSIVGDLEDLDQLLVEYGKECE